MKVDMETLAKSTGIANTELLKGFVRDFFCYLLKRFGAYTTKY